MRTYNLSDDIQVIGHAGETGISVALDVTAWKAAYADGVGAMLCQRPDNVQVPLQVTVTGNTMAAELPDECMSRPGIYTYTATWTQAGLLRLSGTYKTIVLSTSNSRGLPPDCPGTPEWATQIFVKAEQIDAALDASLQTAQDAQDARDAKEAAEDAQEAAEAARDRAETAADTITTSTVEETLEYLGITE